MAGRVPRRDPRRVDRQRRARELEAEPAAHCVHGGALMIGLALVTLVATLAAGIVQTFRGAVDDLWVSDADYAVTAQNNFSPIPIAAAKPPPAPGRDAVGNVRTGEARVFHKTIFATAVDPTARASDHAEVEGRLAGRACRTSGTTARSSTTDYAERQRPRSRLAGGRDVPQRHHSTFPSMASSIRPRAARRSGAVTISAAAWDAKTANPRNLYSFVKMDGGDTDANPTALEAALEPISRTRRRRRARSSSTTRSPVSTRS